MPNIAVLVLASYLKHSKDDREIRSMSFHTAESDDRTWKDSSAS